MRVLGNWKNLRRWAAIGACQVTLEKEPTYHNQNNDLSTTSPTKANIYGWHRLTPFLCTFIFYHHHMATSTLKDQAIQLKEDGNKLFSQKKYDEAIEKFTRAISLDGQNAVFYANRAASYWALKRHQDVIDDAKKATELDPKYVKAWLRMGDAHDALFSYPESIESYQTALAALPTANLTATEKSLKSGGEKALANVMSKLLNPYTMSFEVLTAVARAHNIPIPNLQNIKTPAEIEAIRKALFRHPKWGHEPRLRFLVIPESEKHPIRQVEVEKDGRLLGEICKLIGCLSTQSLVLHAEDLIAYAKGKKYGVGVGRLHTSYEAYMDAKASDRPLNRRASKLLCRPDTHGTILVMKTTFIKSHADDMGRSEDILGWEKVTEEELKSDEFKRKRAEWLKYQ